MAQSAPIRIDGELYAAAKAVAASQDRSAAQQIAHWARVGRELEASRDISAAAIQDVLSGRRHYDNLATEEQAVVRAVWTERLDALARGIDLTDTLRAEGHTEVVEADPEGRVVHRPLGSA